MGDIIPLRDHAATRAALDGDVDSRWFQRAPDWPRCPGCPIQYTCREVRECQGGGDDPEPGIRLRLVEPPDIVA